MQLFGQNLIIISDPTIAKEILAQKAKTASDRPSLALVKGSKSSGKYLPFLGNNGKHSNSSGIGISNCLQTILPDNDDLASQLTTLPTQSITTTVCFQRRLDSAFNF